MPTLFADEEYEMRRVFQTTIIVTDRGRKGRDDTNVSTEFTVEDLDAVHPLSEQDIRELSHCAHRDPPPLVQLHVAARIALARRLKFGVRKWKTGG